MAVEFCHCLYHVLKHQDVFDFRHFGYEHVFAAQVGHFLSVSPVAVNYAAAFQMVEGPQVVERPCGLYHLVAASERFHGVVAEDERIEFGINRMCGIPLDKHYRPA